MMLAVEGLSKRFGGFLAVNQVSFEVREGEILGLIGPNGSGKSTTFNLISGTLRPTSGSIRLQGREIGGPPAGSSCRQWAGVWVTRFAIRGVLLLFKSRDLSASFRCSKT